MEEPVEQLQVLKFLDIFPKFCHYPQNLNPDKYYYDKSKDYKADYYLLEHSYCDCGCKSAVYVKEEWDGDGFETTHLTQTEYENLPTRPIKTEKQCKLEQEIGKYQDLESKAGIIHGAYDGMMRMIPLPKLVCRDPIWN